VNSWPQHSAPAVGSARVAAIYSACRAILGAEHLVRRRYVDLQLINSCLCSR
jgi:hypothetical protein